MANEGQCFAALHGSQEQQKISPGNEPAHNDPRLIKIRNTINPKPPQLPMPTKIQLNLLEKRTLSFFKHSIHAYFKSEELSLQSLAKNIASSIQNPSLIL
jgi:hypothetical protein